MASKAGTPGSRASDGWLLDLPVCGELTVVEIAVGYMLTLKTQGVGRGGQGLLHTPDTGRKSQHQEPLMVAQLVSRPPGLCPPGLCPIQSLGLKA